MTRAAIARGAFGALAVLLAVAAGYLALSPYVDPAPRSSPAITPSATPSAEDSRPSAETSAGFLHGRITTLDGAIYEGRLRWGGDEEAFWDDCFNGTKDDNPWVGHLPPERLLEQRGPIEWLGMRIDRGSRRVDVRRPFMARFGDIARMEARGDEVRVTLKSGTVFDLDRFEASDFDDSVRVWDGRLGVVDVASLRISTIELLPAPLLVVSHHRMHGTVRTRTGDFTGFVAWNRDESIGSDELRGHAAEGELSLRLDAIRSIARHSGNSSLVTGLDGRELVLSDTADVGDGNRGIYVADTRYGRVIISWDVFERIDFSPGGSGPAYGEFPSGRPLTGSVITQSGRRLAGRLVFDLDEAETTETLDAPSQGVDYSIPFGLVASLVPRAGARYATATLHGGEQLQLERKGDLADGNGGMLIFITDGQGTEHVSWADVAQVDFDRPPAMYPPLGGP